MHPAMHLNEQKTGLVFRCWETLCLYICNLVKIIHIHPCQFTEQRHLSRYLLKQRAGKIINISSVSGILGNAGQSNYAASKAGVIGLTKSVARELASRGICVNAVAPGFVETEMTAVLPEKTQEELKKQIPLGRAGQVQDIANAVAFLASPESDYITGQILSVDGGMAI